MGSKVSTLRGVSVIAIASSLGFFGGAAQAQERPAAPSASANTLEAIVVTATRREEQLQNVPISVSAFSQAALERMQLNDVHSLERATPSLGISRSQADRTSITVTLRGLVQTDQLTPIDPAVGVYIDGVYVARTTGGNAGLIDLNRVEVLRGPQGTLFGRNTIGGAINLVPNKPSHEFGGSLELGAGTYETFTGTGVLNLPVNDQLAIRLTGSHTSHAGFAHSKITGQELANQNTDYLRVQALYDVNDAWNVLLSGDYTRNSNAGEWTTSLGYTAPTAAATLAQLAPYQGQPYTKTPSPNFVGPFRGWTGGLHGTITGDLGFGTLKSVSSFRTANKTYDHVDLDASPFDILGQLSGYSRQRQYSQEFQLYGKAMDNRLDWIVGAFYFHERGRDHTQQLSSAPQPTSPTQTMNRAQEIARNTSVGTFAQVSYNVTDALRLTGGVRYTQDTRSVTVQNAATLYPVGTVVQCTVAGAGPAPDCNFSPPRAKWHYVPFTVGADYKIEDTLLYVKFSRGYRSGGFNVRPSGAAPAAAAAAALAISSPFLPERVNSYEVGVKSDLLDHRLRINLAAYQADYNNIQLTQTVAAPPPASSVSTTTNAGTARIRGLEGEVTAVLGDLRLGVTASTTDPKYRSLKPGVSTVQLNSHFQFVPKYSYALNADYDIRAGYGVWSLHADWDYKGRTYFAVVPPSSPLAVQRGFGLMNARVDLALGDHPVKLSVWATNLLNKKYVVRGLLVPGAVPGTANVVMGFPGDPRVIGATARYTF